jgi:hypothetical protein
MEEPAESYDHAEPPGEGLADGMLRRSGGGSGGVTRRDQAVRD